MMNLFRKKEKQPLAEKNGPVNKTVKGKRFAREAMRLIESGMKKMGNEARETRQMAQSFFRLLAAKLDLEKRTEPPSEEEVREAIEQLKDVGRFSFFVSVSILPGGAISLLGLEILARKFGVKNFTLVPSSFRKNAEWHYPKGKSGRGSKIKQLKKNKIQTVPFEEIPRDPDTKNERKNNEK